jgi:hypothetical protein
MAFTLRITFVGLFTFVPRPTLATKQLVALLPRTGLMKGHDVHQHYAFMSFRRAYLPDHPHAGSHTPATAGAGGHAQGFDAHAHPAAPAEDAGEHHDARGGETGEVPASSSPNVPWEFIPLGRTRVSFEAVAGSGTYITPPIESANLKTITGESLDEAQVGPQPRDSVWAQVILPGADEKLQPGDTAEWTIAGIPRSLTHQVCWKRHIPEKYIRVSLQFLHGSEEPSNVILVPPVGEDTLDIYVLHVPLPWDEHFPDKYEPAPHFDAYYDLYANEPGTRPLPHLNQDRPTDGGEVLPSPLARYRAANTYSCMTSQAPLGS